MDFTSIEKLDKLLKDGKISPEEYLEMKKNLPKPPITNKPDTIAQLFLHQPWQIQWYTIFLFIVALYNLFLGFKTPFYIIPMAICVLFGVGLLYRKKGAFIGILLLGILVFISSIWVRVYYIPGQYFILNINLVFCIILATAWKYFFKDLHTNY